MLLRRATQEDLDELFTLYDRAVRWLAERGSDQWQPARLDPETMKAAILASVHLRQTWCPAGLRGSPAAMLTIKPHTPPGLWTPDEEVEPHHYMYLMIVAREYAHTGLGADLLTWAGSRAAEAGARWIRGDVWTTNRQLHQHYVRQGWHIVRTVHRPDQLSGVLIQRRAERCQTSRVFDVPDE